MTAVWDTAPFSIEEVDRRFRGTYCLHHQGGEFIQSNKGEWLCGVEGK
jgi:hypothetical protein